MKRMFIALVAVFILLIFPIESSATQRSPSRKEELLSLTCEIFPEYASSICNEKYSTYESPRILSHDEILFCETRPVNETQSLTYAQYASGRSVVVNIINDSYGFDASLDKDEFTNFTGGKYGTVSIEVTSTNTGIDGVFTITDFKYKIYDNTFDCITQIGTPYMEPTDGSYKRSGSIKYTEDNNGGANITYAVTFYYTPGIGANDPRNAGTNISLNVHNNAVYIGVN